MTGRSKFKVGLAVTVGTIGSLTHNRLDERQDCNSVSTLGKLGCAWRAEEPAQAAAPNTTPVPPLPVQAQLTAEQPPQAVAEQLPQVAAANTAIVNGAFIDYTSFEKPYAWPLARPQPSLYSNLPCEPMACHHDGTPAVDLWHNDSNTLGAAVFAITNARIDSVKPVINRATDQEVAGCYSIRMQANSGQEGPTGEYFWYTHLMDPLVTNGQQVEVGQQIASVGDRNCNPPANGQSAPHLHLDEGAVINGVPQPGGGNRRDSFGNPCAMLCRNPSLITILNTLIAEMPT